MYIVKASSNDKNVVRKEKMKKSIYKQLINFNQVIEVSSNQYYMVWKDCAGTCIFTRNDGKYYINCVIPSWLDKVNEILNLVK